ncbi:MAG: sigma-70 family RNA polymerase sigma factor [Bacteroidota bacterium]
MVDTSDEEYVRRCRSGERGAFDVLVERHHRAVFNLALRMLRDRDDAADVTQSVFIKAYEGLRKFDDRYKFFSWLYRIAVNESLNQLDHRKRFDGLEGVEVTEEADEGTDDYSLGREAKIQDSLMMLNTDQRAVVVLKHMQGLSYEEIGQVLDIPAKTVKSRLFSARQVLKEILKNKGLG